MPSPSLIPTSRFKAAIVDRTDRLPVRPSCGRVPAAEQMTGGTARAIHGKPRKRAGPEYGLRAGLSAANRFRVRLSGGDQNEEHAQHSIPSLEIMPQKGFIRP